MSTDSSNRRQSREVALQVLFQREFSQDISIEQALDNFKQSFRFSAKVWEYANTLVSGTLDQLETIDQRIAAMSENWSSERMPLVDLNILRVAMFELLYLKDAPAKVAINEAIEISKKYGGTNTQQFISGVLGQLLEELTDET